MGFHPNGVLSRIPAEQRLNVFALVIYIPDPLGRFLDDLRRDLVPGCNPHAHVSVLPPRPLAVDWQEAGEQVRVCAGNWAPFDIVLQRIRIFPVTNVIYLELGEGETEMFRIHAAMNSQALAFDEPFEYHPHITLAQEIPPGQLAARLSNEVEIRWFAAAPTGGLTRPGLTLRPMRCWNGLERRLGLPVPIPSPRALLAVARAARASDIVWVHDLVSLATLVAAISAIAARKPLVVTVHVGAIPYRNRAVRQIMAVTIALTGRWILMRSAAVTFVSERVQGEFLERWRL